MAGGLTGVQALDDGGGVDQVAAAQRTQQVLVEVVDATTAPSPARRLVLYVGRSGLRSGPRRDHVGRRRRGFAAQGRLLRLHHTPPAAALTGHRPGLASLDAPCNIKQRRRYESLPVAAATGHQYHRCKKRSNKNKKTLKT